MKPALVFTLLLSGAALAACYYGPEIKSQIVQHWFAQQSSQASQGLGEQINPQLTLRDLKGQPVKLSSLLTEDLILMVYEPGCSPCLTAAELAAQQLQQVQQHGVKPPRFAILQFAEQADAHLLQQVQHTIYLSSSAEAATPFAGHISPRFYAIDRYGRLRAKKLGWYPGLFTDLALALKAVPKNLTQSGI